MNTYSFYNKYDELINIVNTISKSNRINTTETLFVCFSYSLLVLKEDYENKQINFNVKINNNSYLINNLYKIERHLSFKFKTKTSRLLKDFFDIYIDILRSDCTKNIIDILIRKMNKYVSFSNIFESIIDNFKYASIQYIKDFT